MNTYCCICLETSEKYTQKVSDTKCEHPVCKHCFKQMIEKECFQNQKKIPCPICRTKIESPEIEIASAIDRIKNIRYECIYDPKFDICDEIIFFDEDIIFIIYEELEIYKTSKKTQLKKFNYMNKIVPRNRNRNIKINKRY